MTTDNQQSEKTKSTRKPARKPIAFGLMDGASVQRAVMGQVRMATLVRIRWFALVGQLMAILIVHYGLGFALPLDQALSIVAASAIFNVAIYLLHVETRRVSDLEAAFSLAFDILQLAVLLYLTGGLLNPFSLLFLVPVTISATVLSLRATMWLGLLAVCSISVVGPWHMPLPWGGHAPAIPDLYVMGTWAALVLGMIFISVYAWRMAEEARRMANALAETQHVLAREQKISALGGLAAAAAHDLGTPLGTIALVAKELSLQIPPDSDLADEFTEDLALITSQTARCREILGQLSRRPEAEGRAGEFSRVTLGTLLEEAADPYRTDDVAITVEISGEPWADEVPRHPEVLHGLASLIENAADFAALDVIVRGIWYENSLVISVSDDGPGFSPGILSRLGDPYVTSRKIDDDGGGGMGLGVFIAKTLLERTAAQVSFGNAASGGAEVTIVWPKQALSGKDRL